MPNKLRFMPGERAFRRQCRALGSRWQTGWHKQRRASALAALQAIPARQRHALLARVWKQEETRRRRRKRFAERFHFWGALVAALSLVVGSVWMWATGNRSNEAQYWLHAPQGVYAVGLLLLCLCEYGTSSIQRGMARRLLWEDLTTAHVGCLVDMLEVTDWMDGGTPDEMNLLLRHLTQLLGEAVRQDKTMLDEYQKKVLRAWVARAEPFLNARKPDTLPTLEAISADFLAVALLALRDTGGWQTDDRETRAARKTIQKIADAAPRVGESVNHRYVRDVARETLPQIQAGRTQ